MVSPLKCYISYVNKSVRVVSLLRNIGKSNILPSSSKRPIMTTKVNLEKSLEKLKINPYFEKYAQKIAKLQETDPEEFLKRVETKEKELQEKKVIKRLSLRSSKFGSSWSITSHLWRTNLQNRAIVRSYASAAPKYNYITTPIFYVNAAPHIGHLYTAALADSITRFNGMRGQPTLLSAGTDEHGNKVEEAAKNAKIPTFDYCTSVSQKFRSMCDTFHIGYSDFIRTTESRHYETVQKFWNRLKDAGHIYKGTYSGWYCTSDEAFLSSQDLTEIKTPNGETIKVSTESGHPVEWSEEENYKFRLSSFQSDLKHWLSDAKVVQPANFHKILSQWVEDGSCLEDLSISRPSKRVGWGIETPEDPSQNIYVWLDALVSYLTFLGYPDEKYKEFWPPSVQVIGKDILKFHGIYWPAFLIAAGLEPPKVLLCHSHWTVDNEKMSKSKGNVVSPFDAANKFTAEGLRYFLLRDSVPHNDANFSLTRVSQILNAELADTFGNLISRCTGKIVNPRREFPSPALHARTVRSDIANKLRGQLEELSKNAAKSYEEFYTHHVVDQVMTVLHTANEMLEYHKPWKLCKEIDNREAMVTLQSVLSLALESTRISALVLFPIVPKLSSNLLDFLQVPIQNRRWVDTKPAYLNYLIKKTYRFNEGRIMFFPKIKL